MNGLNFDTTPARRLPVYLLLDCSGSMAGAPIVAVNNGVGLLYRELLNDPSANETVWIGVITFAQDAKRYPLAELAKFTPPVLQAGGPTALGAALRELGKSLDSEIIPNSPDRRGDFKPLAFLLTDGAPTDEWRTAAQALKARTVGRLGSFVALGCGDEVKVDILKEVADQVLLMRNVQAETLKQFFQWVSASVKRASYKPAMATGDRTGSGESLRQMPAPPPTIETI